MGMCALGDILKAKVDNLIGNIKCVKTYIDDVLVLSKESFSKNIKEPMIIFGILCSEGLKHNAL